jgi:hypothetical protein
VTEELLNRLDEAICIHADGVDTKEILVRLADAYRAHGWPDTYFSCAFAPLDGAQAFSEAERNFLLYQLKNLDAALPIDLRPSGLPLIGRLLDALKRPFHQLVIYYVNDALARVGTAQMIQARLIESLKAELAQTRQRLAASEGRARQIGASREER